MGKKYFPLFIDLEDMKVLIIGGGNIAARRVDTLLKFNADITVIAKSFSQRVRSEAERGRIRLEQREYSNGEIQNAKMVLAATDDEDVNNAIVKECRSKGILVNAVHNKLLCDFYFPAIIEEGDFVIGVTANGNDHKGVKRIAEKIRNYLREIKLV